MVNGPELDRMASEDVIAALLAGEARVLPVLRGAAPELAKAAAILHGVVAGGGRLAFAGAGTSGRLAAAEAAELPGTFGIPAERCLALGTSWVAGEPADAAEDDAEAGAASVRGAGLAAQDVLVAVAASGRTPFTLAAAQTARPAGAPVVAVVNAADSPLASLATVAVELVVGDEVLRGSTRLAAGTAQKIALNTLTTAAMAAAGRVFGDRMVDVVAANAKLRERAAGIVADIAGATPDQAGEALLACDGDARAAVLYLVRGLTPEAARQLAAAHPSLRDALDGGPSAGNA